MYDQRQGASTLTSPGKEPCERGEMKVREQVGGANEGHVVHLLYVSPSAPSEYNPAGHRELGQMHIFG